MRIGIFAKTFAGTSPHALLTKARDAGYACVQYNMACSGLPPMPDHLTNAQASQIAAAARNTGLSVSAISGTYNMIHPDKAVRQTGLLRLEVLIRAARAMGTDMVTLCTGTRDPADQWRAHPDNGSSEAWRDLLEEMAKACAIAEAHDVKLGIEPELANVVDGAAKARQLIDTLKSPALAIVLDPANLFETATLSEQHNLIAHAVNLLSDRIRMAHAKDRLADGTFATAGQGVVDFPHFLHRLGQAGFDGDLVTHGLQEEEAPGVAAFLARTLAET